MSAYPSPNNMRDVIAAYNDLKQKIESGEADPECFRNPKLVRFHFMELNNGEVIKKAKIPVLSYEARDDEDEPWRHFVSECCGIGIPLVNWIEEQENALFGISGVIDTENSGNVDDMMREEEILTGDFTNVLIITKDIGEQRQLYIPNFQPYIYFLAD